MSKKSESSAQADLQTDEKVKKAEPVVAEDQHEQSAPAAEKDAENSSEKKPAQEKKVDYQKLYTELQQKYDKLEDKYLRAEAEMANMHTRFKKEQEKLLKYDGQGLAKEVLPVIDNLDRALKIEVTDDASKQLKHGIELVHQDMEKALGANHVTKIKALGQAFDPVIHQAVKTVPVEKGQKPETVVEVFQDGYMLKDRVLRPAMVVVAQ
ncbi:nucleotide exchange factor GrpE [Liquorilactobacillus satsumensis]|uniref:Protein GrpE n=1 Tax=Liquorilactobacillus satsumensis DSM 16230 = JCM 12392 TaxID=1423801 RepID=A0A0R1V1B6_9LACO|nr:nucleotide exchange factor GrpE [Liquorilactobacillus satsumensis]KRL99423.1 GrpE protein [Liquorilactobacillus satsumensis DSM 16230 = JCM 12392]